jgi:O-antigen ligase
MLKLPAALQPASNIGATGTYKNISLALAACLVFLIPFDASRNIDLQGMLLIISGSFAWIAIFLGRLGLLSSLARPAQVLLTIFGFSCLVSLSVNPHFSYNFVGAPYIRLGIGAWLACLGIGLLCSTIPKRRLLGGLYALILGLTVISIPYTLLHAHSLLRAGGIFSQADILACFLGCGLLFGLEMSGMYPGRRRIIMACQVLMGVMLFATQTRAVILLVLILGLVWVFQHQGRQGLGRLAICAAAALLLLITWNYLAPTRLADTAYASRSFHYRLSLQDHALRASVQKPLGGYGPGNLADALYCPRLLDKALQTTCDEGYFFNSSHNIFIDRALAVGWPGALAFLALTALAIYRGFRDEKRRAWSYPLILISGYYLTNVTSVTLELLFWVLLVQCLLKRPSRA